MDYSDIDFPAYDRLERSLIDPANVFGNEQSSVSQQRRLFQNRRFIQQAISNQKQERKHALSVVQETERRLIEVDRKRRHHLLQGIKLRNKLQKLSEVQQMSTILLMERELRRRNQQKDLIQKRQQYAHRRNSTEDRQQLTHRMYNERRLKVQLRSRLDQQQLNEQKIRLKEQAMEEQRNRVEKTRQDQARLKNRMKRYEAFKSARAMDNYNEKVLKMLDEQRTQEQTIRVLYSRENQQREILKKTQKLGQSSTILEKMLEGKTFELTTL